MSNQDFNETLQQFVDEMQMYHFEGEQGISNLNKIAHAMGYKHGLLEMLVDNPFLQTAIYESLLNATDYENNWTNSIKDRLDYF
jgi:hypothetical protein